MRAVEHAAEAASAILDFLYPPRCYLCGSVGRYLCAACQAAWPRPEPPVCPRCGDSLPIGGCPRCAKDLAPLSGAAYACLYAEGAREAVHLLKYAGKERLAAPMAEAMARALPEAFRNVDVIVPVGLHPRRERRRGYNQSAWLARELSPLLGATSAAWTARRRNTRSQVGLSIPERARNVQGAFTASPEAAGKRILLVDDVCTTGATAREAARALLAAGAAGVTLLTFARDA